MDIVDIWKGSIYLEKLVKNLSPQNSINISGLSSGPLASLLSSLFVRIGLNMLIVVDKEKEIPEWMDMLEAFNPEKPLAFPLDYPAQQIEVIRALESGVPRAVIACERSIREKIPSPIEFKGASFKIDTGISSYEDVLKRLYDAGYTRNDVVGESGEFARRGTVIDFWPPDAEYPYRIIFRLDRIMRIKEFDPLSQRTIKDAASCEIIPAQYQEGVSSTLSEYLGEDFITVFLEGAGAGISALQEVPHLGRGRSICCVNVEKADMFFSSGTLGLTKSFSDIKKELEALAVSSYRIILSAPCEKELKKLKETVREETGIEGEGIVSFLQKGFIAEDIKTALVTIGDVFPSYRTPRRGLPPIHPVTEFSDLNPGDYVIHRKFGIGIYEGIEKREHASAVSDFLKLRYSGSGRLYVAVENADVIQKYIGSKWKTKLDSLSGKSWGKTTYRVRESVRDFSKQLIKLFKSREKRGISFKPYPDMEEEFAGYFPYILTRHQEMAVDEVLNDMASENTMDRLVCGDVGYGKTEVAMRAAFRAVLNGYQVALLAPTTVLARQHFHRFRERFKNSPVIIEMLSRLVTPMEQKSTIRRVNDGKVDIVIGTHRLLSGELKFPSLGLIIVDEEQRFGVEQKEKLRFKFGNVDVLTTTATPIPRTLAMAMGKLKGFSLINTPPPGRQGILTQTMPYDMETVREAILREVKRGGQCYYVHSRVGTIKTVAKRLEEDIKGISFRSIHGRMPSEKINEVMSDFIEGRFDCLVSTTIIENGLDLPNVNTMIIDYSHRLGLADIYQLRGRIGRSNMKAYCYLMYPGHIDMTGRVKERLSALTSFSAMGSGFQLALRDLNIRGAGDLLGPEQHGNIMKVGFELYSSILKEEISKLKGEKYVEPLEVEISLPVSAYIPESYIDSSGLRLAFYRRLSGLSDSGALSEIETEMEDRFGPVPEELKNLFRVIEVKIIAAEAGIDSVIMERYILILRLSSGERIEREVTGKDVFITVKNEIAEIKKLVELKNKQKGLKKC
ncbi:MAG: DEAD/DEAH box helicase [Elusimicrobiota bacterium]